MKRTVEVDFAPDSTELAEMFCAMDAEEQASFFNSIAVITAGWKTPFCFQLQAIIDNPELSAAGRSVMREIGEYGNAPN